MSSHCGNKESQVLTLESSGDLLVFSQEVQSFAGNACFFIINEVLLTISINSCLELYHIILITKEYDSWLFR